MNLGCIIQARMDSTRLPGKVLKNLDSETSCLDFILNQLKNAIDKENIVIATTKLGTDDKIENFAKKNKINFFRGESSNVLDRYYNCAKKFSMKNIIRITSDCPLIDPNIILKLIEIMNSDNFDYVSNVLTRTFPIGLDVEIFRFSALERAWKNANLPSEKEHVTPYMKKNPTMFKLHNYENSIDKSNIRLTLDTAEDLNLIKTVVSRISSRPILFEEINKLFDKNPSLLLINGNIKHDGYEKSLREDKNFNNGTKIENE